VPQPLRQNWRQISSEGIAKVENSIRNNYHTGWRSEANYTEEGYKRDLNDHLRGRLEIDRTKVIPWIDAACPLKDQNILEIGCGTGSSTVALTEQGARVFGVDIDEGGLAVASDRCTAYGVVADFRVLSGDCILETFAVGSFDSIIFFACLEHMTIAERLSALNQGWALLPSGGLLIVIETPNRLWYRDTHTSLLPFYHWLPNELAFRYARLSPRENFNELYNAYESPAKEHFLRRGRGVSYHEFDLAIGPAAELLVVSSLRSYHLASVLVSPMGIAWKAILRRIRPDLHGAFFEEYLDLIIRKP
jgi:S-adenosylmethionine-dependent methyltransferase